MSLENDESVWPGTGSDRPCSATWLRTGLSGALGEIRTHTARVLNPFPLPVGIRGRADEDVDADSHLRGLPNTAVTAPRSLICRGHATMCTMTGSPTDAVKARRVLIAEDEALIRMDLAEMLREEGYEVVGEAGDGQEAVELAESLEPDLVIMDVKMPRRDGIDAASEIASKRIAPIVVLTAFSQRELVERARDAGAMAYLVKPFSITDLVPAIEVAMSRFSEISALELEVATLSDRLETRKLVERAKGLLQAKQGMTEPEAFKWIQRAAMDRRTTMKRVAEVVLETLDTPAAE
jgi:two-component system, response regulator PdtaR